MAHSLINLSTKSNVYLASAMETANNLSGLIKEIRSNIQKKFLDLFRAAGLLA